MSSSLLCSQFHWQRLSLASDVAAPQVARSCPWLLVVMFNTSCLPCLSNINPPLLSPVPHYSPLDLWCTVYSCHSGLVTQTESGCWPCLTRPLIWDDVLGLQNAPDPYPCDYGLDIMVTKIKWRTYLSIFLAICSLQHMSVDYVQSSQLWDIIGCIHICYSSSDTA